MGEAKRRKQLDPNYGKPIITATNGVIDEEIIKVAGAEQPSDDVLPPAITWGIQLENIHDYQELFIRTAHFINRGCKPAKYLFTTEQFNRVLQSLIDKQTLVFKDAGYYLHPTIEEQLRKK